VIRFFFHPVILDENAKELLNCEYIYYSLVFL